MNFGPSSESRRSATGNGAGTSSQGLRKAGKKGAKVKGRDMVGTSPPLTRFRAPVTCTRLAQMIYC